MKKRRRSLRDGRCCTRARCVDNTRRPRCRSGSPTTEPSGPGLRAGPGARGQVGPPGPRTTNHTQTQPNPAPHWTQGANGGQ
jgi:hypothetical protein